MANFISERSSSLVQFTADTNLVASPITLVCNRQYELVDYNINVVAGNSDNNLAASGNTTRLTIDSYTAAGALDKNLGTVATSAANPAAVGTFARPASTVIAIAGATVANALISGAAVPRGYTLRIGAAASGTGVATTIQAQGYIRVLPGNRYGATTASTSYYANNASTGAQGSSATQSI